MISTVKRRCHRFYLSFLCLKGDPRKIAMGMAIGVFIGVTPTIPFPYRPDPFSDISFPAKPYGGPARGMDYQSGYDPLFLSHRI